MLGLLVVALNLGAQLEGVFLEDLFLFLLNAALLLLDLLLLVDYAEEFVALLLGLLSKALLALEELALARVLHIAEHLLLVLHVTALLVASLALALLEGALGTQGIDLRLAVRSLLLELAETSNLALLLLLDALEFCGLLLLAEGFVAVVVDDLLFEVLFFLLAVLLDLDGSLVCLLDHFGLI